MAEWDRVAWTCLYQPWITKAKLKFEDFHPFRHKEWLTPEKLKEVRESLKGYLPKELTPEEREARYIAWCRRRDAENERE